MAQQYDVISACLRERRKLEKATVSLFVTVETAPKMIGTNNLGDYSIPLKSLISAEKVKLENTLIGVHYHFRDQILEV